MTNTEKELLDQISEKLRRGDIQKIAVKAKMTRERVGYCLNSKNDAYNQTIVSAALDFLSERDEQIKESLKKITSL